MASNIKPKVIRKELRAGVDALFDGYERFVKQEAKLGDNGTIRVFAGATGQVISGRFDRTGAGNVAVMVDAGVEVAAPDVTKLAGADLKADVGVEGGPELDWGHDGSAVLEWHAALFVIAAPPGSVDMAKALTALVQQKLPTTTVGIDQLPTGR